MSNILLAYRNRADAATLSAGSWSGSFPLNNLKTSDIGKKARSTNALAASTLFAVDLGASYALRVIGMRNHNLSTAATVRYRTAATNTLPGGASNYDSGTVNALQMTFQGDTPANWGAQYDVFTAFAAVTARYLYIEITDTANAAGYVEIGRLFIGTGLQPAKNASFAGKQNSRGELSTITTSVAGKIFGIERRRPRNDKFALNWLTQAEADAIDEMQAQIGMLGEVFYVPDPADLAYSQRYGGLGTLGELGAIGFPYPLTRAIPFEWKEKL
jgi:hypothetical protein